MGKIMVHNYACPRCGHHWARETYKGATSMCSCGYICNPMDALAMAWAEQKGIINSNRRETNMEPKLYQVSAVEQPTTKAKEAGAIDRVLLSTTDVLALSMAGAAAGASKSIKGEWDHTRTKWFIREFKNESN